LEPVTHFLTGAVLGRSGFNRKTALATATMTLAAEAPDLDVFWGFKGPVYGFAHHRGFTHSFLGLILVSAVVTGFMYLVWRLRGRRTNIPDLPLRWGLLFLFAYIAGLSHILLDYTNNYGVRPFWPFSEKWYSWGVAFIVEPPLLILLGAALVLPAIFARRHSSSAPRGGVISRVALICIVALWAFRAYEARNIVQALRQQTFNAEPPLRVSAFPYWTPVSPWRPALRWSGVVETKSFLLVSDISPANPQLEEVGRVAVRKPPRNSAIEAAERSYLGRVYLDWAGYPLVTETDEGPDIVVEFQDLRFGYPRWRSRSVLAASVTLDHQLHVVGEAMGERQQIPPVN
jgi:inner membrane protein